MKQMFWMLMAAALALQAQAVAEVKPQKGAGRVAQMVVGRLERIHVLQRQLDDEMSRRAWTNLVTSYDFNRMVFLKEDIEAFKKHQTLIDDELRQGNVSFGFNVYNLFVKRFEDRMAFVTNLLVSTEFDFSKDEDYTWKRKDADWPATPAERDDLWRKRIKNEYLMQLLGKQLDIEKAAAESNKLAKAEAAGKDKTKKDAKKDEDEYKEPELTPKENLLKRYRQYAQVMTEPDEEQVLQRYLSAVTMAFDPHSDYMSPTRKEEFDMDMSLTLCGVGAVLSMDDGALKIVEVMPGGPIAVDGRIKKGDKIVGVDQFAKGQMEDVLYKPMHKTIRKIRGPKGKKVTLEIIPRTDPSGATRKRITLVRDEIKLQDQAATGRVERVTLNGVTNRFGYVKLPGFYGDGKTTSCAMDVARYVQEFNDEKTDGMVLDFRGNGGGSLQESVLLAQLFLWKNYTDLSGYSQLYPVVQVKDTRGLHLLPVFREIPAFAYRKPMVVLIDRASASASEIVAGVLKDSGRAVVIGDRTTHGKGTVQTVLPLGSANNGSVKVTTARFYRINGSSTQERGVESDLDLPSILEELDIGEDKLPNALPWSRVQTLNAQPVWNLGAHVPQLKAASDKRLAENPKWRAHMDLVKYTKLTSERTTVPLERGKRLAMMRKDREMREAEEGALDGEADDEEVAAEEIEKENKDGVVLEEAFNVLADLVRLTKGEDAPPEPPERDAPSFLNLFQ